jgi:hypothetical protein
MVKQVTIVAILMMIQGVLESLMGVFLCVMGPFIFTIMQQMPQNQPGAQPPPEELAGILSGVYVLLGVVALIAGVLKIVAGVRNLKYRGKVLGIVALASGVATIFTCYCAPTAIALLVYGLIVYLNADVGRAFAMGEQGMTPDQIKAAFDRTSSPPGAAPFGPT